MLKNKKKNTPTSSLHHSHSRFPLTLISFHSSHTFTLPHSLVHGLVSLSLTTSFPPPRHRPRPRRRPDRLAGRLAEAR
ncbi:hypothetical protein Sjap_020445 [Stephania japonica]|uniref:Uncharacterized protein n=1 Tax=Stephania japonica TaxID=461633 RepID=A0AAP0F0Q2_9MAGN